MAAVTTESVPLHPFREFRRERRWVSLVALAASVFLHTAVIVILPEELLTSGPRAAREAELEVTLAPDDPAPPEALRFVEANPDAPENEPDETDRYSFRSQQAADERPDAGPEDAPVVEGETDSQKIVQGALERPALLEPGVYSPDAQAGRGEGDAGGEAGAQARAPAPTPPPAAPDFLRQEPEAETGSAGSPDVAGESPDLNESVEPEGPVEVYRRPEEVAAAEPTPDAGGGEPGAKPMPRPRPRLDPELVTGPLMQSQGSAAHRGTLAIDATFSEFGEYQQQFYAALQVGWYREIEFFQPIDTATKVLVSFTLRRDGAIEDVEVLHTTASDLATTLCENAIIKRSPFRPWTKEMVEVFGDQRTLRVLFHYR